MKVVVDIYGADYSPNELIEGCLIALQNNLELEIIMVGKEKEIKNYLKEKSYDINRVEIINADMEITCNESPTTAIKTLIQTTEVTFFLKNKPSNGTITIYKAVKNPALPTVVCRIPIC